ncbi:DUF4350 domain-containing protein [Longispora albida]|uniref:DUF4350 domain-containing protein n=1 Tax=Longispora albida TaxID=203523 RepID=UPI000360433B|nr:DUF4350 domain-containing protein [Longispora albida]
MKRSLPKRPLLWKRLNILAPLIVALVVVVITVVFGLVNSPSPSDEDFADPEGGHRFSGQTLSGMLAERGVEVNRYATIEQAMRAALRRDTTLFIPAPGYLTAEQAERLDELPAGVRVVLVEPGTGTLGQITGRMAATDRPRAGGGRWTTAVVPRGECALREVPEGDVAIGNAVFTGPGVSCYGGSLHAMRLNGAELVLAGAADPFLDERIGEHGNAALAVALLSRYGKVAWADQHSLIPKPEPTKSPLPTRSKYKNPCPPGAKNPNPAPGVLCTPLPSGSPVPREVCREPDRTGPTPQPAVTCYIVPYGDARGEGGGSGGGDRKPPPDENSEASEPPNPLWGAFPPWVWAIAVGLLFAALLVALARARRLGGPAAEKLPVVVRSAETVTGRGRLYARAKARDTALDALRAAAMHRMLPVLGLRASAGPAELVPAVAWRSRVPEDQVHRILYGQARGDAELLQLTGALDRLVLLVLSDAPGGKQ